MEKRDIIEKKWEEAEDLNERITTKIDKLITRAEETCLGDSDSKIEERIKKLKRGEKRILDYRIRLNSQKLEELDKIQEENEEGMRVFEMVDSIMMALSILLKSLFHPVSKILEVRERHQGNSLREVIASRLRNQNIYEGAIFTMVNEAIAEKKKILRLKGILLLPSFVMGPIIFLGQFYLLMRSHHGYKTLSSMPQFENLSFKSEQGIIMAIMMLTLVIIWFNGIIICKRLEESENISKL